MTSRRWALALVMSFVGTLAIAPTTAGASCNGDVTQIDVPDGSTYYVDMRDPMGPDFWIYQESNGLEGLQSGGTGPFDNPTGLGLILHVDGCVEPDVTPDTIVL